MNDIPRIYKNGHGFSLQVDGKPYIILASETHNSACTSREYMREVWAKAVALHCNTLLAPVYWELFEPQENDFDFSLIQQLIKDARTNHMKLILLWFGGWKNGYSTYTPGWVKTNPSRFPRVQTEQGISTRTLSMFDSSLLSAEQKAFTKMMELLKAEDGCHKTVIAVQVENELGILGATRDFSPGAGKAFSSTVPLQLIKYLQQTHNTFALSYDEPQNTHVDWGSVFGIKADEIFMCWHYAQHINSLVLCGKEIYPLPMFTNVWLKEFDDDKPGSYPCGGPVPDMLDIWKCGAPALDIIAPDIYSFEFEKAAKSYTRYDNPLFIPETRRDRWAVPNLYTAIGTYHALCYSPFGAESIGEDHSYITQLIHTDPNDTNVSSPIIYRYLAKSYQLFQNMTPIIAACYGTDKMKGFSQTSDNRSKRILFGKYRIDIEFYHPVAESRYIPGAGVVIDVRENELLFIGYGYRATVETLTVGKQLDFLSLEKGHYDSKCSWHKSMSLNGDEQCVRMEEEPTILRAVWYEF